MKEKTTHFVDLFWNLKTLLQSTSTSSSYFVSMNEFIKQPLTYSIRLGLFFVQHIFFALLFHST